MEQPGRVEEDGQEETKAEKCFMDRVGNSCTIVCCQDPRAVSNTICSR